MTLHTPSYDALQAHKGILLMSLFNTFLCLCLENKHFILHFDVH